MNHADHYAAYGLLWVVCILSAIVMVLLVVRV